mgnify:CR=1 FL=1
MILTPRQMYVMTVGAAAEKLGAFRLELRVQFTELCIRSLSPTLYQNLGIFLPLITTNCAVLGVALLNSQQSNSFIRSLLYGFGAALGFLLVLVIFAGLRERLALANTSKLFAGSPIAFITAGLLSMAFLGFSGLPL